MKLGEMKKDADVHVGTCENFFGNWTKKAFNAEGKRIFKNHPEYEYLREDPWLENKEDLYSSVLYAYMKDCILKEHPEHQDKYNEIVKEEIFAAKGFANYDYGFKDKEDKVYSHINISFLGWYDDYTRELADPGVLAREQATREKEWQKAAEFQHRMDVYNEAKHPHVECPYCHSTNTEKISTMSRAVSVSLVGAASGKIGKQWHCKQCGSDF